MRRHTQNPLQANTHAVYSLTLLCPIELTTKATTIDACCPKVLIVPLCKLVTLCGLAHTVIQTVHRWGSHDFTLDGHRARFPRTFYRDPLVKESHCRNSFSLHLLQARENACKTVEARVSLRSDF